MKHLHNEHFWRGAQGQGTGLPQCNETLAAATLGAEAQAARRGASHSSFLPRALSPWGPLSAPARRPASWLHSGKSPALLSLSFLFICQRR